MSLQHFRVLPEHVVLLRNAYVSWEHCEFGAPSVDCKRPYGNSDVHSDMAVTLLQAGFTLEGFDPNHEAQDGLPKALVDHLDALHRGTQTALQIFLRTGEMRPGLYEAPAYSVDWKRIGD